MRGGPNNSPLSSLSHHRWSSFSLINASMCFISLWLCLIEVRECKDTRHICRMLPFARQVSRVRRAGAGGATPRVSTWCRVRTYSPRVRTRQFSSASSSDPDAIIIGAGA